MIVCGSSSEALPPSFDDWETRDDRHEVALDVSTADGRSIGLANGDPRRRRQPGAYEIAPSRRRCAVPPLHSLHHRGILGEDVQISSGLRVTGAMTPNSSALISCRSISTPVPPRVRLRVLKRFGRRCDPARGCGRPLRPGDAWTCDHIEAIINGGPNRERNLHPLVRVVRAAEDAGRRSREIAELPQAAPPRRHQGRREGPPASRNDRQRVEASHGWRMGAAVVRGRAAGQDSMRQFAANRAKD
jgi:5-methylcytosine-specific restriction protein A